MRAFVCPCSEEQLRDDAWATLTVVVREVIVLDEGGAGVGEVREGGGERGTRERRREKSEAGGEREGEGSPHLTRACHRRRLILSHQ